jgi:hypothetical protein
MFRKKVIVTFEENEWVWAAREYLRLNTLGREVPLYVYRQLADAMLMVEPELYSSNMETLAHNLIERTNRHA